MTTLHKTEANPEHEQHEEPEFVGGSADARAHRRRSVLWPASLKVRRHNFGCQIWNMSLGGARVRLDMPIKEGSSVTLTIAGRGAIPAVVRWSEDNAAGLEFKIPSEEVRLLFIDSLQTLGLEDRTGPAA